MNLKHRQRSPRRGGYTLVETMFAVGITAVMFLTGLSAITFSNVQQAKDRERSIMYDFASHYMEILRGLSFDNLTPGMPINPLYDGVTLSETSQKTTLRVPANAAVVSLTDTNYTAFCPDLSWVAPRNPTMSFLLTTESAAGVVRTRHVGINLEWDSPLGRGAKQRLRLDMVRVRDIEPKQ